jgi:hypothetical protein
MFITTRKYIHLGAVRGGKKVRTLKIRKIIRLTLFFFLSPKICSNCCHGTWSFFVTNIPIQKGLKVSGLHNCLFKMPAAGGGGGEKKRFF